VIGIVDWGIGGLWALRRVLQRQPLADVVYVSDAGNTPFGLQDRRQLARSVNALVERARDHGARRVLVACHSASTVLPDLELPGVHGVITGGAVPSDAREIGVIGGARTVRSQAWRRALSDRAGVRVSQRIAQPLSALVEAGRAEDPETRAQVRRIVAPLDGVDTLVLACTHYAALAPLLQAELPSARLVDPAVHVVDGLELPVGSGRVQAWTTGEPARVQSAVAAALPDLTARVRFRAARPA